MQRLTDNPCGRLVPTIEAQYAFVPDPLPPELPMSPSLVSMLDRASRAVGILVGIGETSPNPHLLIQPFLRREAVLSSRIEGTQASLSDVFAYEAKGETRTGGDVAEVVNYVRALRLGIDRLGSLPISLRLINEVHERLMQGVRGENKRPGTLRDVQVWIGRPGSSIRDACFVPPPPDRLRDLLYDWERFVNEPSDMPPLVRCALMHYQIETIHPYPDGNGRIGRLLITLFLSATAVLPIPLLYMSGYFERDRQRYYDGLLDVSITGDWEPWLLYFLEGVYREAEDALERLRRVRNLQDEWRELLHSRKQSASSLRLLEDLLAHPMTTVRRASALLDMSDPGARRVLDRLIDAGIVTRRDNTWPHLYVAQRLLDEIERPIASGQE